MEQATLIEVKNDGQTLVLADGRELNVDPGDITTAILWLPTSLLEISDADDNRRTNSLGLALSLPSPALRGHAVTYRIHRSATPDTVRFALSSEMDTDHAARLQGLLANAPLRRVYR
jgi:hypothetical protein